MTAVHRISRADAIALCCLSGIFAIACYTYFGKYAFDDSYFGYSIAQSILHGRGFSLNGERILSTSAPLAPLLYAGVAILLNGDVVLAAQLFSALAFAVITFGTYAIARQFAAALGAFVATVAAVCGPFVLPLWSHETLLFVACCVVAVLLFLKERFDGAALLFGAATLLRGEGLFIVPFAWCAFSAVRGRRAVGPFALITITPFLIWSIVAVKIAGSPFSATIASKHAQSLYWPATPYLYGLNEAIMRLYALTPQIVWGLLFKILTLFCAGALIVCGLLKRAYLLVAGYAIVVTALYVVLQLPFYLWFCTQIAAVVCAFIIALWSERPEQTRHEVLLRAARGASVGLASLSAAFLMLRAAHAYAGAMYNDWIVMPQIQHNAYRSLGEYVAQWNTSNKRVAFAEFGQIHYYSGMPVVDYLGIATPQAAQHLQTGNAIWTFKKHRPDVVIATPTFDYFVAPAEYDWFRRAYRFVVELHYNGDPARSAFKIYRLVRPGNIPPPGEIVHSVRVLSVSQRSDAVRVQFALPAQRLTEIELRTRLYHPCSNASVHFAFGRTDQVEAIGSVDKGITRFTMQPKGAVPAGGVAALSVTHCRGVLIAPQNELRRGFAFFNKWPPQTGAAANAFTAYGTREVAER